MDDTTIEPSAPPKKVVPRRSVEELKAASALGVAARKAKREKAALPPDAGIDEFSKIPLAKHRDTLLMRAAFLADKIYKEINEIYETGQADKQSHRLRNLTWNYGVLHDKVVAKTADSAGPIRLPARLLEAIQSVIKGQLEQSKVVADKPVEVSSSMSSTDTPAITST